MPRLVRSNNGTSRMASSSLIDLVTADWVKFRSRAALAIDGEFRTRSKINSGFNLRWREVIARKDLLVNFSAIPAPNENHQGDADEGNARQAHATVRARIGVVSRTTVWYLITPLSTRTFRTRLELDRRQYTGNAHGDRIACAVRVWIRLAQVARQTARSLYQVKHGMPNGFLRLPLKNPSARMEFTSVLLNSFRQAPSSLGCQTSCDFNCRKQVERLGMEPQPCSANLTVGKRQASQKSVVANTDQGVAIAGGLFFSLFQRNDMAYRIVRKLTGLLKIFVELRQRRVPDARLNARDVGDPVHALHQIALCESGGFLGVGSTDTMRTTTLGTLVAFLIIWRREISRRKIGHASKQRFVTKHVPGANRPERVFLGAFFVAQEGRGAGLESMMPAVIRDAAAWCARFNEVYSDWNVWHGFLLVVSACRFQCAWKWRRSSMQDWRVAPDLPSVR